MKTPNLVALAIFCACSLISLGGPPDSLAVKYSKTIRSIDLSRHLHIIASDSFLGRETGQPGQKLAADYISKQFASFDIQPIEKPGLLNGYYQQFPLELRSPEGAVLTVGGVEYRFLDDFYYFQTFEDVVLEVADVVFVGYGIEDDRYNDYAGLDVEGRVLLAFSGEPTDKKGRSLVTGSKEPSEWLVNWRLKQNIAEEKKAAALIILSDDYESNLERLKHYVGKPRVKLAVADDTTKSKSIPTFYVSPRMSERFFEPQGRKEVERKLKNKIRRKKRPMSTTLDIALTIIVDRELNKMSSENVLGFIEGTDKKEEVLIITAHYDHLGVKEDEIFNGADDDGSGTVALIEMAEAFALARSQGHGPRRSVLFMPVSGEEKGLLGSEYYVTNPVFPLENTIANLNIDMIGRADTQHMVNANYVYLIGADKLSSELHAISSKCNNDFTRLDLDYTYNDPEDPNRFYYRSDHYNFAKHNIPVIFYFTGVHEDYHKSTDTVDKIDFAKMEKITKLVFFTAWALANRDERIIVDKTQEE